MVDDCIGLRDLLAGAFTHAILTNYKVDVPWLLNQSSQLTSVPVLLCHGSDQATLRAACAAYTNIQVVAPPLPIPYGTHHTKMMVLFYATSVRVAIFTANFVASDWDAKTQGVWYQDFPLRSTTATESTTDFEKELRQYLSALHASVATMAAEKLPLYDFDAASVTLIASVPGVYTAPNDMARYGHLRLRKVLRDHGVAVAPSQPIFSSLGSLTEAWLRDFLASFSLAPPSPLPAPRGFHIVWPSVAAVRGSIEGYAAGRSLPCPLKNLKPFLHRYLRTWDPPELLQRTRVMPHIKTFARIGVDGTLDFALLTSANLSQAAWGSYQKQKSQFMIRSYELGVLFLPTPSQRLVWSGARTTDNDDDDDASRLRCPLPYKWPPTTYNTRQDEPWSWDQTRDEVDDFGETYLP
ncbi:hypothetical protein SPRG_19221 [Saprolegnia parasitica CBS 223.65]|uniref:Tyrosyl-DNA phosphodiesterase 1 n=1 Tax=Saprolegnia parasitica (strain CBS 223.65) TaxID=695850 RepID=A0A067CSA7_SAPPC|nr:hypothetical protein SPRG_19221 [Saprolegnia parasitica CBS 223.65]KDO33589.1 hypothetical protein SPRG_19221 [Saprolegnia parasitica CBS 223.65]|eukprot:XP_012195641.1 hypothetical protein SPRG_19221 [Saprolegnia parasitica CBS 223.65]